MGNPGKAVHARRAALLLLALLALTMPASDVRASPANGKPTWTKKQEGRLRKLEKKARKGESMAVLAEGTWRVECPGSPRLAAEINLYMELLEERLLGLLGGKRVQIADATVKVFPDRAAFIQEVSNAQGNFAFRFRIENDQIGPGVFRNRVVENHLYTFMPDRAAGEVTLGDFNLTALRREGARGVLCGISGQLWSSAWFEVGVSSFCESIELNEDRKTWIASRRDRSARSASLRRFRVGEDDRLSLAPLFELTAKDWNSKTGVEGLENVVAAEGLVDYLLTERKAKSLRDAVVKAYKKAGGTRAYMMELEKKDVRRLERAFAAHLETLRSTAGPDARRGW